MKIGVALVPNIHFQRKVIEVENRLHTTLGFMNMLGEKENVPHITLFQGNFDSDMSISYLMNTMYKEYIKVFKIGIVDINKISCYDSCKFFIDIDKSKNIMRLHNNILDIVKDRIILDDSRYSLINGNTNYDARVSIINYGSKYMGKNYRPHITIGKSRFEDSDSTLELLRKEFRNLPKTIIISKIVIYKVGDNGVYKETLKEMYV